MNTNSEAEALADSILRAAGSGLRHYSMQKTRDEILDAARKPLDQRDVLLEALKDIEMNPKGAQNKATAAIKKATTG